MGQYMTDEEFNKRWEELKRGDVSRTGEITSPKGQHVITGRTDISPFESTKWMDATKLQTHLGKDTLLGRIIDVLSRGEYASANMAKDYLLGRDFDPTSAIEGLKGEKKITYDDLVNKVWPDWSPWKKMAVSFGLAVFADPTTYIPTSVFTKPIQMGGKALKGTKIGKAIKSSKLAKLFVPGAGLPKDYYELKRTFKDLSAAEHKRLLEDISYLGKGISQDDMKLLSYFREHPDELGALPLHLRNKLADVGQRFDDLIDDAVENGIISPKTGEAWHLKSAEGTPYMYHHYPGRGVNIVRGGLPPDLFTKMKKPTFMKGRSFETLEDAKNLASQMEDISKAKNLDDATKMIDKYGLGDAFGQWENLDEMKSYAKIQAKYWKPEENILKAYGLRKLEQTNVVLRNKFVDSTLKRFGRKVKPSTKVVPEGYGLYYPKGKIRFYAKETIDADTLEKLTAAYGDLIPVEELAERIKKTPGVTGKVPAYMLPKEVANDMNRMAGFFEDFATNWWVRNFWDRPMNAWKLMATAMRLPFHLRNMYSNWFQAYLSGMRMSQMPDRLLQALRVQGGKYTKLDKINLGNKTFKFDELLRAAQDNGVFGKGWIGADVSRPVINEMESIIKYGRARHLNPANWGRYAGQTIENNARLSVFLDQLDKGASFPDAAKTVKKYLFDYSELTPFERKIAKRFMPFYTWTRKNIPLQIEHLLKKPRKYQVYAKGQRAFAASETKEERKYKPKWFEEMLYLKSPFETDLGRPIYMSIDLPPQEFNRLSSARHWISSIMNPAMIGAQIALKFKTFPELTTIDEGYTQAPFWVAWLNDSILKGMDESQVVRPIINPKTGKYQLGMKKTWVHALHTSFPFLNELNRIYAQPVVLDDERPQMKWNAYTTGIGHYPLDIRYLKERRVQETKEVMRKVSKRVIQTGKPPTEKDWEELDPHEFVHNRKKEKK